MKAVFLWGGVLLCAFALWAVARHDWQRLTRPRRRVIATVIGHRSDTSSDGPSFAAIYRFTAEDGTHEVTDSVFAPSRQPPAGAQRLLHYPAGRPDLARPPRPLLWFGVYALLAGMGGVLLAKALGLQLPGE